jgi:hypothetical protein
MEKEQWWRWGCYDGVGIHPFDKRSTEPAPKAQNTVGQCILRNAATNSRISP